jgi:D-sedoheptulose 7-phosphate isomerase
MMTADKIAELIKLSQVNIGEIAGLIPEINAAANLAAECLLGGGKILACGNGGSAADASHLVGELVGRLKRERPGMAAITLNSDIAVSTSLANDYSYEGSLARQVTTLGNRNDLLVAISTSGHSPNIIAAARAAKHKVMKVLVLTGPNPSELATLCNVCLRAPGGNTQLIQEAHGVIIHILCLLIEDAVHPA